MEVLIDSILNVGKAMVVNGTEVRKVEDAMERMLKSYGLETSDIFVMSTVIILTVLLEDGRFYTQSKRIIRTKTDLGRYEDFNKLSRFIVENNPKPEVINKKVEEIYLSSDNGETYESLGFVLGSGAFSIFFGGNIFDGITSGFIGYIIYLMNKKFKKPDTNKILYTVFSSIVTAMITLVLVRLGIGSNIDKIMIGDIMLFMPGLGIINSVKDIFYGDIITGLFGFVEYILVALAIVIGFGIPSYIFGVMV